MPRLALLIAACVALVVASACGGGNDTSEVKQTVRDFVSATNDRDGDELCNDLLTQDYLEKATGATGDKARDACKQQLDLISGLKLRLIELGEPKIDGDTAVVRATITTGSQRTLRRFRLRKEGGDWKLNSGS